MDVVENQFENICQLLSSDKKNGKVGLEILKGQSKQLKAEVKEYFAPLLEAFDKSTLRSIPAIFEKLRTGKLSLKEREGFWKASPFNETVEEIYIPNTRWPYLPETVGALKNLKQLRFITNEFESLPKSIGNLHNLETLDISFGPLKKVPDIFERLVNLKKLRFSGTGKSLEKLPDSIGELKNLKELWLSQNNLKSLPESVANLVNLEEIYINSNQLTSLPKEIGNLKKLERLVMDGNPTEVLPDSFANLSNLKYLSIHTGQIEKGIETIGALSNLEELTITKFFPAIGELKQLKKLSTRDKSLTELPQELTNLKQLEYLSMNSSGIAHLSSDILTQMPNLKTLDMSFGPGIAYEEIEQLKELLPQLTIKT